MQRALACLGIAFIILAHPFIDLVSAQAMIRFHSSVSLAPLIFSLWIDLVVIASIFLGGMLLAARLHIWHWLRIAVAAWLPWLLVRRIGMLSGYRIRSALITCLWLISIALLVYLARKRLAVFTSLLRTGSLVLACLGASTAIFAAQMVPIALWKPAQPLAIETGVLPAPAQPHARIVWIVLDELSYNQAFEDRAAGLDLPALDAVARESIRYLEVQPVGDKTDRVMPSLLLGQPVLDIRYTWSNRLLLQPAPSAQWLPFRAEETVFAQAKRNGWHTGVAGWYNPYCSLLAPYLDSCAWDNEDMDKPAWSLPAGASAYSGALEGLSAVLGSRQNKDAILAEASRSRLHLESARESEANALELASNDGIDLMLLHLPVPHFPNVYDRRTRQFSLTQHSYADNLALADRSLGSLTAVLQHSPRWANTTLIVCGDHSWRTTWWRPTPYWTAEDERISHGGHFDPRPALLVHFPGQTKPYVNPQATSLFEVHRILAGLLATGRIVIMMPGGQHVFTALAQSPAVRLPGTRE